MIGVGAYMVGSLGHLFIKPLSDGTPDVEGSFDGIMPAILIRVFSSNILLIILLSIILLLLLSASILTLEALVLSSSSAVAVDLIGDVRSEMPEYRKMRLIKWLCVLFVALSFFFALMNIIGVL